MLKASMSRMFTFARAMALVISAINPGLSLPVAVITAKSVAIQ